MGHEHQLQNLTIMHDFLCKGQWFRSHRSYNVPGQKIQAAGPTMAVHDLPGTPDCSCVYAVPQCQQQDHAHALTDGTLYFQVLCPNTPSRPSLIPW